MNAAQEKAVDKMWHVLHNRLSQAHTVDTFIFYLHSRNIMADGEKESIEAIRIALGRLTATLKLIKNKENGWDGLISFLENNADTKQLAMDLQAEAA